MLAHSTQMAAVVARVVMTCGRYRQAGRQAGRQASVLCAEADDVTGLAPAAEPGLSPLTAFCRVMPSARKFLAPHAWPHSVSIAPSSPITTLQAGRGEAGPTRDASLEFSTAFTAGGQPLLAPAQQGEPT